MSKPMVYLVWCFDPLNSDTFEGVFAHRDDAEAFLKKVKEAEGSNDPQCIWTIVETELQ